MGSQIYCIEMNGEIVGYAHGDFDYHCKSNENEKAYDDAHNAITKIFNNMGFESDKEYFRTMYYNNRCIGNLTRDITGTIIYYKVWKRSAQEDPVFEIRMTSELFSDVDSSGRYYSYTRIDRDIKEMLDNGNPCMFLIQPKIKECWYEVGKHDGHSCFLERTVPPDAVWFCEDWDNKTERHKLEYWFYQLTSEGKRLCSFNEPHWPTDDEVRGPSLFKYGYYDEGRNKNSSKTKQKQQEKPNLLLIAIILLAIFLMLAMPSLLLVLCLFLIASKVLSSK